MNKVYASFTLTGNTLLIVTLDGNVLVKSGATGADVATLKNLQTEEELYDFITDPDFIREKREKEIKEEQLRQEAEAIKNKFEILRESEWFDVIDNTVYFKGINRSLPPLLVDKFAKIYRKLSKALEEGDLEKAEKYRTIMIALKRFQMWAFANPRAEVADDLYGFLKNNTMRITKQGLIVALRNVVTVEGIDTTLVRFISESYNKMKAAFWLWRKNPKNFDIYHRVNNKDHYYLKPLDHKTDHSVDNPERFVGNLEDLYHNLPNLAENRFTDAHTRTFDIRVGKKVWMDPKKCSWSTADCGERGLHFTLDEIHYVGCGDTSVMVLINPMKIVGIGESKGRCYEYLPFMTVDREEATQILRKKEFNTLDLDFKYAEEELENLEETIKKGFVNEAEKYQFNIPQLSSEEVKKIVEGLSSIKDRIVNID